MNAHILCTDSVAWKEKFSHCHMVMNMSSYYTTLLETAEGEDKGIE